MSKLPVVVIPCACVLVSTCFSVPFHAAHLYTCARYEPGHAPLDWPPTLDERCQTTWPYKVHSKTNAPPPLLQGSVPSSEASLVVLFFFFPSPNEAISFVDNRRRPKGRRRRVCFIPALDLKSWTDPGKAQNMYSLMVYSYIPDFIYVFPNSYRDVPAW